ncbi:hypothetical protein O3P69_016455 [Scylla paramamosain]|uniref:Uncharacterized protein n=1 Tax=Scylla paramamosain TaxID=85552 RepID=A0AAW0TEW6_SCYPA
MMCWCRDTGEQRIQAAGVVLGIIVEESRKQSQHHREAEQVQDQTAEYHLASVWKKAGDKTLSRSPSLSHATEAVE